jgi:hypothetical protein
MKKKILPGFLLLSFLGSCSTGKSRLSDKNDLFNHVKDYSIRFDKIIETNFTASGTLHIQKKGDLLIMYDSHVSDFRLAAIEYSTGKEIWTVPYEVRGYWYFEDKILVEGNNSLEMITTKTGESYWKMDECVMRFQYGNGTDLGNQVLVVYHEKDAILDLTTRAISNEGENITGGFLFKQDMEGSINKKGIVVKNKYSSGNQFCKIMVVEDRETAQDTYVWKLDAKTRTFTLTVFGHNDVVFKEHNWTIPENIYTDNYDVVFSGLPEPEKLSASIHCTNDLLFLYESYENYRWSWGKGCNRITAVDLNTYEIKYQVWGMGPTDKHFQGFHFFNDQILVSNGVMHFQEEPATFHQFDDQNGKLLDSLPKRFTRFEDFAPGILIGFVYERKQVKDTEYTNKVFITAWDYQKNEFSPTYDFDFQEQFPYEPYVNADGSIIFHYYDHELRKDILYCCKIVPK